MLWARSVAPRAGAARRALGLWAVLFAALARAPSTGAAAAEAGAASFSAPAKGPGAFDINEYRVEGAEQFSTLELEKVLSPFLGPHRALEDVEAARMALERAYADRGFQAVSVAVPAQTVRGGVVTLKVTEGKVGRLRVHGARYYLPSEVKRQAPSMAEGQVLNLNDIVHDIVVLNQLPDRRVTPALHAGEVPGTVDVDLNVKDRLPGHGSLEVNNRYSPGTTHTRLNGSIRYDNLWQLGHSLGFAFQIAPKRLKDGEVYSGTYLARLPDTPWLSFSLSGLVQNSDVSTLGGIAVAGKGRVFGGRANFTLPGATGFFHTVSAGLDYKRFLEDVTLGGSTDSNPITYWPVSAQYVANWSRPSSLTQLTLSVVVNIRGLSSPAGQFDAKRYDASGEFTFVRGEVDRTQELPLGLELFLRAQGQYADGPLLGSEQFTAGGVDSVRGYLEVQAAGDWGYEGSLELRGPSFAHLFGTPALNEWRLHLFAEGARVGLRDPLPEQTSVFALASVGGGTRAKLFDVLSGSFEVGVPLRSEGASTKHHPQFHFRLGSEF